LVAIILTLSLGYGVYVLHGYLTDARVETIAGSGMLGDEDGPAMEATFYMPYGIRLVGEDLYVAEHWGQRIRRVRDGYVETLVLGQSPKQLSAGSFSVKWSSPERSPERPGLIRWLARLWSPGSLSSPAPVPPLGFPTGIAAGKGGELYIADFKYHKIWVVEKVVNGGDAARPDELMLRTLVGFGGPGPVPSGSAGTPVTQSLDTAKLDTPEDLWVDEAKNVIYVLEQGNRSIRKIDLGQKTVVCYAGPSNCERTLDLQDPGGFAYDADSTDPTFYIADSGAHVIWRLPANGAPSKIGSGTSGYRNASGEGFVGKTQFDYPADVAVEPGSGILYVTDSGNRCVRKLDTKRRIATTIAGGPETPGHKDGPGRFARFQAPWNLDIDFRHMPTTLYLTDFESQRIRRIVPR
jgi:DNA-binding beta-propeller fold protein YncE